MKITSKQLRQVIQEELHATLKEQKNKQIDEANLKQMIAALMIGAGVPSSAAADSITDMLDSAHGEQIQQVMDKEVDPETGKVTSAAGGPAGTALQVIQQTIQKAGGGQVEVIIDNSGMLPEWWDAKQIGLELQKNKNVKVSLEQGDWYERANEVEVRKAKIDQGKTLIYLSASPDDGGKALSLMSSTWDKETGAAGHGRAGYKGGIR